MIALANTTGGKAPEYEEGVLSVEFYNKDALEWFLRLLDEHELIEDYEVLGSFEREGTLKHDILAEDAHALVVAYVVPEAIDYGYYEVEEADEALDESNLYEVKRIIKVNSRGVKRIKMKCNPGYKYNTATRACEKISGAELSTKRKALRRAVLTKRSMGSGFKMRMLRKTRKAKRFRKSLGLKT